MTTQTLNNDMLASARKTIAELNIRMQELTIEEMRGRKVSSRLRRSLMRKRDEAHKLMRSLLGSSRA